VKVCLSFVLVELAWVFSVSELAVYYKQLSECVSYIIYTAVRMAFFKLCRPTEVTQPFVGRGPLLFTITFVIYQLVLMRLSLFFRCTSPSSYIDPQAHKCVLVPNCSVPHCVHGDCVVVGNSFQCNCFDGWTSSVCDVSINGPSTEETKSGPGYNRDAAIAVPVIIGGLLLRQY
jgi:hypothetical protein